MGTGGGGSFWIALGYGDGVTLYQGLEHEYVDVGGGFEAAEGTTVVTALKTTVTHTFTNTSGEERVIREVQLRAALTTEYDKRTVLDLDDMTNLCLVPNGASVEIVFWWWNLDNRGVDTDKPTMWYVTATLDTSTFTNTASIHYNGIELPDAGITAINKTGDSYSWTFQCHATSLATVQKVMRYAAPLTVAQSVLGKQFVSSPVRAGTLNILNLDTLVHTQYANCYVQGPISANPTRTEAGHEEYHFTVTVIQSAYGES